MLGRAFVITTAISVIFSLLFLGYTYWVNTRCENTYLQARQTLTESLSYPGDHTEIPDYTKSAELIEIELKMWASEEEIADYQAAIEQREKCRNASSAWTVHVDVQTLLLVGVGYRATILLWLIFVAIYLYRRYQNSNENPFEDEEESVGAPPSRHTLVRTLSAPSGLNAHQSEKHIHPEILIRTDQLDRKNPNSTKIDKNLIVTTVEINKINMKKDTEKFAAKLDQNLGGGAETETDETDNSTAPPSTVTDSCGSLETNSNSDRDTSPPPYAPPPPPIE